MLNKLIGILLLLFISLAAWAQDELTAEQQKRAQYLYYQVKCPVCNGQSIAESDNQVSLMIRHDINKLIIQNHSNEDILQELEAEYNLETTSEKGGNFYLYLAILILFILLAGYIFFLLRSFSMRR